MILKSKNMRKIFAITALSALAGCFGPTEGSLEMPRTVDSEGRAVASPAEAANVFLAACYGPKGKQSGAVRYAKKAGYSISQNDKTAFFASSKSKSISLVALGDRVCSVSFDAGIPNADAGARAAQALMTKLPVKKLAGKSGGGSVDLITSGGVVTIANNSRGGVNLNGASISLYRKR